MSPSYPSAESEPRDFRAAIRLAQSLIEQGRHEEAFEACETAASEPHLSSSRRLGLAQVLVRLGEEDAAVAQLRQSMAREPIDAAARLLSRLEGCGSNGLGQASLTPELRRLQRRALQRLVENRPELAEPLFAQVIEACPAHGPAWLGRRGALTALGQLKAADDLSLRAQAHPALGAGVRAAMRRKLSPRGLPFDPEALFPFRSKAEALTPASNSADLLSGPDRWLTLDPGGEVIFHDPVIPLRPDATDRQKALHVTPERFVMSLEAAAVAWRGVVLTRDGEVISDYHQPSGIGKYWATEDNGQVSFDATRAGLGLSRVRFHDTPALVMVGNGDGSHGDWMINFPPRLALAEAAGIDCKVLVNSTLPQQYLDMLAALGVGPERLLFHDISEVSVFPRLYVPSWPMNDRHRPMKGCYDIYRRARRPAPSGPGVRLYLSREKIGNRLLLNETEVREAFVRRGFQVIYPEAMGFAETRDIFAGAACVAGPYGSGFRNIVFSERPPTCFLVMPPYPKSYMQGVAIWIGMLGASMAYVPGVAAADGGHPNLAPWIAPLDEVERGLDEVLARLDRDAAVS